MSDTWETKQARNQEQAPHRPPDNLQTPFILFVGLQARIVGFWCKKTRKAANQNQLQQLNRSQVLCCHIFFFLFSFFGVKGQIYCREQEEQSHTSAIFRVKVHSDSTQSKASVCVWSGGITDLFSGTNGKWTAFFYLTGQSALQCCLSFTNSHTHTHTPMAAELLCKTLVCTSGATRVQCLTQGHFNTRTEGTGTANPGINGRPTPPPEPRLPRK